MKDDYTLCLMRMHYITENDACSYDTGCSAEAVTPQSGLSMSSTGIPFWSRIILIDLSLSLFNSYKSSVLFAGHMQTVQTQIRRRIMRCLIRVSTVYLQNILFDLKRNENYNPTTF